MSAVPAGHADVPVPAGEFFMGDAFGEGYRSDGERPSTGYA